MAMWDEYMDQRKQARVKEEEDLKKLKERQVSFWQQGENALFGALQLDLEIFF